ncbi:GAF domain-containing protein [Zeaxanthinibacter sp. PT1]|uniref:GAF domain-containing protein n=1 Tax=Zeaxanthinibacter TaxID=561554 RepID=UPI00234955C3|nr:GAF domain-containing protein [Zeaxanthinibacter sp. PT1]MDC6351996.1 GAF domain-containing protein [Zeaxanthinibacter sp. PT1]
MDTTLEIKRLENLHKYGILDTPQDGSFDEITSLAVKIFDVPISIISLVDTDRIWFKSSYGLDIDEIPKEPGLCSSAILSDDVYIVENARKDPRTLTNPLVTGALGLQFYAAAPLITKDRFRLGNFVIIDAKPRSLNGKESSMLIQLSRIVMDRVELQLEARELVRDLNNKGLAQS